MRLIEFPEQTVVIAKDQPEYMPFPAHFFHNDQQGRIACCWRLGWRERVAVLLNGVVWHQVITFNQPLQPQLLTVEKPDMSTDAYTHNSGIIADMLLRVEKPDMSNDKVSSGGDKKGT